MDNSTKIVFDEVIVVSKEAPGGDIITPYGGFMCGVVCTNGVVCGLGCGANTGSNCGMGCS